MTGANKDTENIAALHAKHVLIRLEITLQSTSFDDDHDHKMLTYKTLSSSALFFSLISWQTVSNLMQKPATSKLRVQF